MKIKTWEEITKMNKVVSDFMEIETHEEQSLLTGVGNIYLVDKDRNPIVYHSSYDSLMDVWKKIRSLEIKDFKHNAKVQSRKNIIVHSLSHMELFDFYYSIVKLIEYLNKHKLL